METIKSNLKKITKTRIIYLSTLATEVISPIPISLPKGCVKLYPAFETEKQAKEWGGEIIYISETTNH